MDKQGLPYEVVQKLVEVMSYSFGTTIEEECKEICDVDFEELSYANIHQIESQIFQCSCCGYWFKIDFCTIGEDGENWCNACYEERNDYDDM